MFLRVNNYSISYFICPECKRTFPIPRPKSIKRNKGHIKDLYCVYCNKTVKTIEIRNGDYYVNCNGKIIYA